MKHTFSLWAAGVALLLAAAPAFAYIDPGTGSMLVQSALAIIAIVLVAWRTAWEKVKSFFSRGGQEAAPTSRRDDAADREA